MIKKFRTFFCILMVIVTALTFVGCDDEDVNQNEVPAGVDVEEIITYAVSWSYAHPVDRNYGSVSTDDGYFIHLKGTNPKYTIKPNNGYAIASIIIDNINVFDFTNNDNLSCIAPFEYVFTNISSDHTMIVDFTKKETLEYTTFVYDVTGLPSYYVEESTPHQYGRVEVLSRNNDCYPLGEAIRFKIYATENYYLRSISLDKGNNYHNKDVDKSVANFSYDENTDILTVYNIIENLDLYLVFNNKPVMVSLYSYTEAEGFELKNNDPKKCYINGTFEFNEGYINGYDWYYARINLVENENGGYDIDFNVSSLIELTDQRFITELVGGVYERTNAIKVLRDMVYNDPTDENRYIMILIFSPSNS